MEDSISIKDLFKTLQKRWLLITILTLSAGLISGVISHFLLKPVYQTSTQILVNQKNPDGNSALNANQLQTNVDLINTYSAIIKSPAILNKVVDELNNKQSIEELNQKITVSSQENSQIFYITVKDTNPANATKIANTVSETFQKEIQDIMNVNNVNILSKSVLKENPTPVKPDTFINIMIALIIGLMVGIGLAFLLEYLDNTIKDEREAERLLGLPVIGSVPKVPQTGKQRSYKII